MVPSPADWVLSLGSLSLGGIGVVHYQHDLEGAPMQHIFLLQSRRTSDGNVGTLRVIVFVDKGSKLRPFFLLSVATENLYSLAKRKHGNT